MASVSSLFQSAIKTMGLRVAMALFLGALLAAMSPAARAAGETRTWTTDAVALGVQAAAVVLLVYVSVARDLNRGTLRPTPPPPQRRRRCQKKTKKRKDVARPEEARPLSRFRAFFSFFLSCLFSCLSRLISFFFLFLFRSRNVSHLHVARPLSAPDAVVVGRFVLPRGSARVAHPLAHAMPVVAACAMCGEAYGVDDPACFSDDRARTAYALAVTQCAACKSIQPGAWTRRPGDDQWTDIVDQTRLADHGDDTDGGNRRNVLSALVARDLCVREVAPAWSAERPFVVPVDAREVAMVLALDAAGDGDNANPSVTWTRVTRHRPWPWYFV